MSQLGHVSIRSINWPRFSGQFTVKLVPKKTLRKSEGGLFEAAGHTNKECQQILNFLSTVFVPLKHCKTKVINYEWKHQSKHDSGNLNSTGNCVKSCTLTFEIVVSGSYLFTVIEPFWNNCHTFHPNRCLKITNEIVTAVTNLVIHEFRRCVCFHWHIHVSFHRPSYKKRSLGWADLVAHVKVSTSALPQ